MQATYAFLTGDRATYKQELVNTASFTSTEADGFVAEYQFVHKPPNTGSGFAATLFLNPPFPIVAHQVWLQIDLPRVIGNTIGNHHLQCRGTGWPGGEAGVAPARRRFGAYAVVIDKRSPAVVP